MILNGDSTTKFAEASKTVIAATEVNKAIVPAVSTVTSACARISLSSCPPPSLPSSCDPGQVAATMQFNECSIVIYQGNGAPSAPPVFPPPAPFLHSKNDLDCATLEV